MMMMMVTRMGMRMKAEMEMEMEMARRLAVHTSWSGGGVERSVWWSRNWSRSSCARSGGGEESKGEGVTLVSVDRSGLLRGGGGGRDHLAPQETTSAVNDAVKNSEGQQEVPKREPLTPLVEHLKALISVRGPIPVATFMSEVLTNPVCR